MSPPESPGDAMQLLQQALLGVTQFGVVKFCSEFNMSNAEPLPLQITAICESVLPRQALRFVLADDTGAGETITAGL